jgi:anti-anti-sigma factor
MTDAEPKAGATAGTVVVTLPAEIDVANADRVSADLHTAFGPGVTTVVADMTATTFCDSQGINALVRAHKHAATTGAQLRVVVPSTRVLRVLAILGLDCRLAIYSNLRDALAAKPAPNA